MMGIFQVGIFRVVIFPGGNFPRTFKNALLNSITLAAVQDTTTKDRLETKRPQQVVNLDNHHTSIT